MRVISRGNAPGPEGEPLVHVEYEHGELRPIFHKRPRRHDCDAQVGEASSMDDALEVLRVLYNHRCPVCHNRIFGVRFPMTATLPDPNSTGD